MKKNLFFLFSLYFFVVQSVIIWLIWNENKFFLLSIINLIFILLIVLIYNAIDEDKEKKEHIEKDHNILSSKKKISWISTIIFIISLIFTFLMYLIFTKLQVWINLFVSIFLWFAFFVIFGSIFQIFKFYKFWKMIFIRFYFVFLFLSAIVFIYQVYYNINTYGTLFTASINQVENLSWENEIQWLIGSGEVIATSLDSGNNSNWLWSTLTWNLIDEQDLSIDNTNSDETDVVVPVVESKKTFTVTDAISYLLKKNNVPLITTKDILFQNISTKNVNYSLYRTAYSKKMVGKDVLPGKIVYCKTYIVMKWLAQWRDVNYTANTVFQNFWAEAERRWELNWCVYGSILKEANL